MTRSLLPLLLITAAPATAPAQPEWRQAIESHVLVRVGAFEPDPVRLVGGLPARLVFYNSSPTVLSLEAKEFFGTSRVRPKDADEMRRGKLVLEPGESREIVLVPTPGRYRMRSGSLLRRAAGMSAEIIVDSAPQRSTGA